MSKFRKIVDSKWFTPLVFVLEFIAIILTITCIKDIQNQFMSTFTGEDVAMWFSFLKAFNTPEGMKVGTLVVFVLLWAFIIPLGYFFLWMHRSIVWMDTKSLVKKLEKEKKQRAVWRGVRTVKVKRFVSI